MKTRRLTVGQAVVEFLIAQYVGRDRVEHRFFAGVLGIFGHDRQLARDVDEARVHDGLRVMTARCRRRRSRNRFHESKTGRLFLPARRSRR